MNLIQLVPITAKINFLKRKTIAFIMSGILISASIGFLVTKGLNFGIDFTGGISVEVEKSEKITVSNLRNLLKEMNPEIQSSNSENTVSIRLPIKKESEQKLQLANLKTILGADVSYRSVDMVGPKVGGELIEKGIYAIFLALFAIAFYIWIRFEMSFAIGALSALFHDIVLTLGFFSLIGLEFNLTAVAAILTIAGYSVNDTVVVYDRVRENLRKYRKKSLADLLNLSLNETLSRTILTSLTTFLAVIALVVFGGNVLGSFSYALLFGIVIGTYSSMFIAVPLLTEKIKQ
ncbi:MAG: protein translocase subunit SecF [Alphaproteobacteria bacterium]